jgi:DNA-binding transcriptional regulator YiaG
MSDEPDDYPRRKLAQPAHDEYVALLIDRLRKLEQQTHPRAGQKSAVGKDFAAFEALSVAGEIVNALAGWALDHQVGLALKNLEFVPLQPSGTKGHPDYLQKRASVDDHAHEKNGGFIGALDPIVARRLLINLLRANSGGFCATLVQMATEAFEALDYGESRPMLAATKGGKKRTLAVRKLELRAIGLIEYRYTRGGQKLKVLEQVARMLGVAVETVRSWELRLRKEFGNLAVSRTISFAHNAALNEKKAAYRSSSHSNDDVLQTGYKGPSSKKAGYWENQYGADALRILAERYKEALRQT